jgi:hypothetical protein
VVDDVRGGTGGEELKLPEDLAVDGGVGGGGD